MTGNRGGLLAEVGGFHHLRLQQCRLAQLVIDQPEDNLDNRLIRQVIVNILATIKLRRQVIVATHNPNLPVLGDVEQAVVLRAVRDRACTLEAQGELDSDDVVRYITEIMEGGREAFQYRQMIYQTHWKDVVSRT